MYIPYSSSTTLFVQYNKPLSGLRIYSIPTVCKKIPVKLHKHVTHTLTPKQQANLHIIDPHEEKYTLDLLEWPVHWLRATKQEVPPKLNHLMDLVYRADGFIFVTTEYNRAIPPALTNLLSHIPPMAYDKKTWALKAGLICSYSIGNLGGIVAAEQMRGMVAELG